MNARGYGKPDNLKPADYPIAAGTPLWRVWLSDTVWPFQWHMEVGEATDLVDCGNRQIRLTIGNASMLIADRGDWSLSRQAALNDAARRVTDRKDQLVDLAIELMGGEADA